MFEVIHGSLTGDEEAEVSFHHPNQYFEESYKRLHKPAGKYVSFYIFVIISYIYMQCYL